jgi:hypothetical protein
MILRAALVGSVKRRFRITAQANDGRRRYAIRVFGEAFSHSREAIIFRYQEAVAIIAVAL